MQTDAPAVRHIALAETDSTNAEALRRARDGEPGPLWITAATQAKGRGRGGNIWVSEPGNLYATLLLGEPSPQRFAPQLAFVGGLAVYDAVAACAPNLQPRLRLKWPNDLLCEGKKLAGLLIEAEGAPAFAVAIGIGINCASHPAQTSYPATDLKASGTTVTSEQIFGALTGMMQARLGQWESGRNFASVRRDWLERAAGLGEPIKVRVGARELAGRFTGVDESGSLLIDAGGRTEAVQAGEVFALGAA